MFSRNSFAFFYVRPLLLLAFVASWISCCIGCGVRPAPQLPQRAFANELELETVAMVTIEEDAHLRPFCAGVWISPVEFVTAGHCVRDLGKSEVRVLQEQLAKAFDMPLDPWDPVGKTSLFALRNDLPGRYWTGTVEAYDEDLDLGLVKADAPAPLHVFARLSLADVEDGDRVAFVGHPLGSLWSYGEGYVSSSSVPERLNAHPKAEVVQVAGPLSRGNSGGGLFDESGHLLGISSYTVEDMNGMGFFVHRDSVRAFLRGAGAA